jgi:hypothetical protein
MKFSCEAIKKAGINVRPFMYYCYPLLSGAGDKENIIMHCPCIREGTST